MFKRILIAVTLFCIGSANAQLVQNGAAPENKVNLSMQQPLVVTGDSLNKVKALDDSVSTVNKDPTLVDAVRTGAISIGAEIAGQTLKGMLFLNSMETNAVEKEREYR